jgi:hypothetical protein
VKVLAPLESLLRFPFASERWRNHFLIGTGLIWASFIIPLLPMILVYGYSLQVMRQAIDGEELSLPKWDDWGRLGKDGLWATVVGLVYLLPAFLVFGFGFGLYFLGIFAIPFTAAIADSPEPAMGLSLLVTFGGMGLLMVTLFLGMLLLLLGSIPLPMAVAHVLARDDIGAAFHWRRIWRMLRSKGLAYLGAWVVVSGLMAISYMLFMLGYYTLVLICFTPLLLAPLIFYGMVVGAAVFGESYREARQALEEREPGVDAGETDRGAVV